MAAAPQPSVPLPAELSVRVTIKIGAPYSNSRTGYGAPFLLSLVVAEGMSIFRERVRRHLSTLNEIVWAADGPILVRPAANAPQRRYETIAEQDDDLDIQLTRLWRCAGRRREGHAGFVLEAFVYVTKVGNQDAIRRASAGRVSVSTSHIQAHLTQTNTRDAYGPASRRYWAINHARQPDGTPVAPPESTTFAQLQSVDVQQREIDDAADARAVEPEFMPVRCRLNGDIVKMYLSVEDMRSGLGLPA